DVEEGGGADTHELKRVVDEMHAVFQVQHQPLVAREGARLVASNGVAGPDYQLAVAVEVVAVIQQEVRGQGVFAEEQVTDRYRPEYVEVLGLEMHERILELTAAVAAGGAEFP